MPSNAPASSKHPLKKLPAATSTITYKAPLQARNHSTTAVARSMSCTTRR